VRSTYKLVEIVPGTFIYADEETAGRYICPVCYENANKMITLRRLPATTKRSPALPERYVCPAPEWKFHVRAKP